MSETPILRCDMRQSCTELVAYIDNDGYVYCTRHGLERKASQPCRKLKPADAARLLAGGTITYHTNKE